MGEIYDNGDGTITATITNHPYYCNPPIYTDLPHGKGHSTKHAKFTAKHTAARKAHRRLNKKHNR
jgi:hypothetical protein